MTSPTSRRMIDTAVDLVVLSALITVAAFAFAPAYGGVRWMVAAAGGALVGGLAVSVAARLGWHALLGLSMVVAGYFLVGPGLATPSAAISGWLPSLESTRQLAIGVVTGWRQMLTVAVPVGSAGSLLIPVFLTAVLAGAAALTFVGRTTKPLWALVFPLVMMVAAALLGTVSDSRPLLVGGLIAGVSLGWASWRVHRSAGATGGGLDLRRPVSAALVIGALAAGSYFAIPVAAPENPRTALREYVVPPFDPREYPSPLAGFRYYVKTAVDRESPLLTVSGLPAGGRIRLAALDQYDGISFNVSTSTGAYTKVGDVIPDETVGQAATIAVTIGNYSGIWLPEVGRLTGISFTGKRAGEQTEGFRYSSGSATGVVTSGVAPGDTYTMEVVIPDVPTDAQLASLSVGSVSLPTPTGVPDKLKAAATTYSTGQDTIFDKAEALRATLVDKGLFSHGDTSADQEISPAGHGSYRLKRLLDDPKMVGDQEQFATAMVLMARTLGIPARVVMGLEAPGDYDGTGELVLTGEEMTAWAEIYFQQVGWVVFDPTPDVEEVAQTPVDQQQSKPREQNLQPPPPPQDNDAAKAREINDEDAKDEPDEDKADDGAQDSGINWLALGLAIGLPLLLIGLPLGLVLLLKHRRRGRRRNAADPVHRIAGGWREFLDNVTDLGIRVPAAATREEIVAELEEELQPAAAQGTLLLAKRADARIFGPETVDDIEVDQFWAQVRQLHTDIGSTRPGWRRLLAKFSPVSLLRRAPRR